MVACCIAKKRVKSLLIPFLIWNVLYIVLIRLPNGRNFDFLQDFGISTVTPANSPLWYVKVLFQMCLISPVIIWFVKRIRNCMLVLILGISVLLLGLDLPGWKTYWRAILYFSFGIWLAMGGSRFACLLRNKFVILSIGVGYIILMSVRYVLSITDFDLFSRVWLYVPVVLLPLVWRLYDCFLKFPWIRKMGDGHLFCGFSFFIYCSHLILIDIGCRYVNLRSLHGSLMLGLSVVAVSLGIGYFLRCFVPKVYLFLMGGRG